MTYIDSVNTFWECLKHLIAFYLGISEYIKYIDNKIWKSWRVANTFIRHSNKSALLSDNIFFHPQEQIPYLPILACRHRQETQTVYLPACCSIKDNHRFRQQGNRERQQTSMLLLWWTASTVRFSMSMCSMCDAASSPAMGVWRRKKEQKKSGAREQESERMSNELRCFRHLHSLPVFFRRGEKGKKENLVVGWLWGLEENESKMKAFLEATKELYAGKGPWSPQWAWRTHRQNLGRKKASHTMPPDPMLGSKSQPEMQKEHDSERQNRNDGPTGNYSICSWACVCVVLVMVGAGVLPGHWYTCMGQKGQRVSSAIHLKTNCVAQRETQSNCIWVWSGFCLFNKKRLTIALCVALFAKSQEGKGRKLTKTISGKNMWTRNIKKMTSNHFLFYLNDWNRRLF